MTDRSNDPVTLKRGDMPWFAQNAVGNVLTFVGMAALVMWWASTQSARIDVVLADHQAHVALAGHADMLERERALLTQMVRLEIQAQDVRRQVDTLRRECPDVYQGMNPTNYKLESPPAVRMQKASVP